MTDLLVEIATTDPELEEDEPKIAHIVKKGDDMRGYIEGTPIQALCGKVWVPTRDPAPLPVCEECTAIKEAILNRGSN